MFGLPDIVRKTQKRKLTEDERESLREAVIKLSELVAQAKDPSAEIPSKYTGFIIACQRQTDNITPRKVRFNSIYDEAF